MSDEPKITELGPPPPETIELMVEDSPPEDPRDRITVVEYLYFNPFGDQPSAVESKFSRPLTSKDEQPYERRLRVGEEWMQLDMGWLKEVSMLRIHNQEGQFRLINPTEEEIAESQKKVLEVRYQGSSGTWLIPPGESMRGTPSSPHTLQIRCQSGDARFTLYAFPA